MRDPRVRPSASLVTILVERIYDLTAVALMFAINLIWFRPPFALEVSFDEFESPDLRSRCDRSRHRFSGVVPKRSAMVIAFFERSSRVALYSAAVGKARFCGYSNSSRKPCVFWLTRASWRKQLAGRFCSGWHRLSESSCNASVRSTGWVYGNHIRAWLVVSWVHSFRRRAALPARFMQPLRRACCFSA